MLAIYRIYAIQIRQKTAVVRVSRPPSVINRLYAAFICQDASVIYVNSVGFVSCTALMLLTSSKNAAVAVPLPRFMPYMGSIMSMCFCCKSILPVYLPCPSSTLSNIGLSPPPAFVQLLHHNKSRLYATIFFSTKSIKVPSHLPHLV